MSLAEQFNDQGFLVFEKAIDPGPIASIRDAAARIVDDFDADQHKTIFSTSDRDRGRDDYFMDSSEAVHCFLEEEALDGQGNLLVPKEQAINKIGHAMHDLVPEFKTFCRQAFFAETLLAIGYENPWLWQTMYIYKQPRIGGEVRWHQDASYLHSKTSPVIGVWVAVEDATLDNGCLWVAPGAHRSPLRELYEVDLQTRKGILRSLDSTPWPGSNEGTPLELEAGGVVFFNDRMPHYSSANRSDKSRQAFTMHLSAEDAEWSELNWLQRPNLPPFRLGNR